MLFNYDSIRVESKIFNLGGGLAKLDLCLLFSKGNTSLINRTEKDCFCRQLHLMRGVFYFQMSLMKANNVSVKSSKFYLHGKEGMGHFKCSYFRIHGFYR